MNIFCNKNCSKCYILFIVRNITKIKLLINWTHLFINAQNIEVFKESIQGKYSTL